jgi:DeoR/GlpR family transcriptional regulator of sugar metabolism
LYWGCKKKREKQKRRKAKKQKNKIKKNACLYLFQGSFYKEIAKE